MVERHATRGGAPAVEFDGRNPHKGRKPSNAIHDIFSRT